MFRDLLIDQVSNVFDIIDDLRETVNVVYVAAQGNYDPAADVTSSPTTTTVDLKVVFTRVEIDEVDSNIVVSTDMKVLIPAKIMGGLSPNETDHLVEVSSNTKWNVMKVNTVPGKSLYCLYVRKA